MMDAFANLATGFVAAGSLQNIGFALIGCMLGTLIGVLPGIGPIPTIAMLLPLTFGLDPLSSLIMLAYAIKANALHRGDFWGLVFGSDGRDYLLFTEVRAIIYLKVRARVQWFCV